jgi:chemotaxis protein MotB
VKTEREQVIRVVRKKRRAHAHHGGAWKVAFADFMTSMMALFLVLWLITQSSEVRTAIAGYFQDPLGRAGEFGMSVVPGQGAPMVPGTPNVQVAMADGRKQKLMELSAQLRNALPDSLDLGDLKRYVEITEVDEGLRISLLEDSSDVFFPRSAARPLPQATALFAALGRVLGAAGYGILLEGHTDAVPFAGGAGYDNWELSADRANAVRRALMAGGVQDRQIDGVRGLGDRDPRLPAEPTAPQNRRVTILVTVPTDPAGGTTTP